MGLSSTITTLRLHPIIMIPGMIPGTIPGIRGPHPTGVYMWDLALTGAGDIPITIRMGGMGPVVIRMFPPMLMVGTDLIIIGIPIIIRPPTIIPGRNTPRDPSTGDNQHHRDQLQKGIAEGQIR